MSRRRGGWRNRLNRTFSLENDKTFSVVDRRQLETIQAEQKFQMSGAVDDKDALAIGKFFGAQTIISGTMRDIGGRYRLTIRALAVQTAQVQGQYNRNMATSETLAGLVNSGGARRAGVTTQQIQSAQGAKNADFKDDKIGIEMVFVQGGTFRMGCTEEQNDCFDCEKPVHNVTVSDFYIGKYEVTQKQWIEVMGKNSSNFKGDNLPVLITWSDIPDFIWARFLSQPRRSGREWWYYFWLPSSFDPIIHQSGIG